MLVSTVEDELMSVDVISVVDISVVEDTSVVDSYVVVDISGALVESLLENTSFASGISACLFFRLIEDVVVSTVVGTGVVVSKTSIGRVVSSSLLEFVVISTSIAVILSLGVKGNVVTYLNINKCRKKN